MRTSSFYGNQYLCRQVSAPKDIQCNTATSSQLISTDSMRFTCVFITDADFELCRTDHISNTRFNSLKSDLCFKMDALGFPLTIWTAPSFILRSCEYAINICQGLKHKQAKFHSDRWLSLDSRHKTVPKAPISP